MEFRVHPIFAKGFLTCNLKLDHDLILSQIKKVEFNKTEHSLNDSGYQSLISKSLNILNDFESLRCGIEDSLNYYIRSILCFPNVGYKIFKSWGTLTPPKERSYRHSHTNSWLSGVYYPHDVDGGIVFHDPFPHHFQIDFPSEWNVFNSKTWNFTPQKGDLIIFPSYLEHSVKTNTSEYDRYSVAFNVHPIGTYGEGDSEITMELN